MLTDVLSSTIELVHEEWTWFQMLAQILSFSKESFSRDSDWPVEFLRLTTGAGDTLIGKDYSDSSPILSLVNFLHFSSTSSIICMELLTRRIDSKVLAASVTTSLRGAWSDPP